MILRPLHIIVPLAGEGSRFLKEGWTTPKPLIPLHGMPLFKRAIGSVLADGVQMRYSFIVRQNHIDEYSIDKGIQSFLPEAKIFSVQQTTRGAVETCLMAERVIDDNDAVVVMDCDLEFRSKQFIELIKVSLAKSGEEAEGGALVSFDSDSPKYSYAEIDENNVVIRTAEKEVISHHALCGAYFFSSGRRFKQVAHQLMNEQNFAKPEYYVSLLYNYLIAAGEKVYLAPMEEYYSYGTPEELKRYL